MAIDIRLEVTNRGEEKIPWPRPPGYNEQEFVNWLGRRPSPIQGLMQLIPIGNSGARFQTNQNDICGDLAWEWPTASVPRRKEIHREAYRRFMGQIYYRANSTYVSKDVRQTYAEFGLIRDAFQDDYFDVPGVSPEVYVRDGRRLVGRYVLTEHDVTESQSFHDSVAIAGYFLDSHTVSKFSAIDGRSHFAEGHLAGPEPSHFEVPLRAIQPCAGQADNILAGWCVSCTRVAWCALRVEPTMMLIGEVAGVVAGTAVNEGVAASSVRIEEVEGVLDKLGAVRHLNEVPGLKVAYRGGG